MSRPALAPALIPSPPDAEPIDAFSTECHRMALERLGNAFDEALPLVAIIGKGRSGARYVLGRFLEEIAGEEISIARLTRPCADASSGMREIIRAIGFQPKDMSLADLEKVFTMFLSYQRTHHRRTVICIEEAQDCNSWMLDKVRRLVEMESAGHYGLTIILSGQPDLNRTLGETPLHAIRGQTRERIYLAPLTEDETRDYVQRRVDAGGTRDISQLVDFSAIGLLHELSGGVADVLRDLCSKCLELQEESGETLITPELVNQARDLTAGENPDETSETGNLEIPLEVHAEASLVARINGEMVHQQVLNRGHALIGRDVLCDVGLYHPTVSRYHALIVNSPRGIRIVDLGSTNGIFINGRRCRQYDLKDKDCITIGECTIQYFAGDAQRILHIDPERTDQFDARDIDLDKAGTQLLRDSGVLDATAVSSRAADEICVFS